MAHDVSPRKDAPPPEGMFSARFVVGALAIALGALFLLDSFDVIESRYVLRLVWPLVFVAVGVVILSKRREGHRRNEGWIFVVLGLWIFLAKFNLFRISVWGILFPSLLLFVGGMLVWRALHGAPVRSGRTPDGRALEEDHVEFIRTFAILSSSELRPVSRPFRGADLSSVLAGVQLDLTSARMDGDAARIEVFAFCGGIEIFVPPDWTVTSKVGTLMGAFTDKRRPTTTLPTKTLVIDGFAIMSGIEVKN